jgi:hypothetical protein
VKKALSDEEWRAGKVARAGEGASLLCDESAVLAFSSWEGAMLQGDMRLAAAALCLHGQPFGFTHDDVELLRYIASGMLDYDYEPVQDLADRIEALLPPRAP